MLRRSFNSLTIWLCLFSFSLSLDSPCLPIHFPPTLHQAIHDFNLVRYELAQVGLITLIAINASGALHTRSEETTVFMKACFILGEYTTALSFHLLPLCSISLADFHSLVLVIVSAFTLLTPQLL